MEIATLTADSVRERLTGIDRRRREARKRRDEVWGKLQASQGALYTAEAGRKNYVGMLAGENDAAMTAYLENEIDKCDQQITSAARHIEANQAAIASIDAELEAIRAEHSALDKAVSDQEWARGLEKFGAQYRQATTNALAALDAARLALARVVVLSRQASEFDLKQDNPFAGSRLKDQIIQDFFDHSAPGHRGFEPVDGPLAHQLSFMVRPAARKTDSL